MSSRQIILCGTWIEKFCLWETERVGKDWLQPRLRTKATKHIRYEKHLTMGNWRSPSASLKEALKLPVSKTHQVSLQSMLCSFLQANMHKKIPMTTCKVAIRVRMNHDTDNALSNQCIPSRYISVSLVLLK